MLYHVLSIFDSEDEIVTKVLRSILYFPVVLFIISSIKGGSVESERWSEHNDSLLNFV